jgi:hypothetical protein
MCVQMITPANQPLLTVPLCHYFSVTCLICRGGSEQLAQLRTALEHSNWNLDACRLQASDAIARANEEQRALQSSIWQLQTQVHA